MNLNQLLISLGVFSSSVAIYYFAYYLFWKIVYKEFPKDRKDLEIKSLKTQVESLRTTNTELKKENQEITNLIIRRLK